MTHFVTMGALKQRIGGVNYDYLIAQPSLPRLQYSLCPFMSLGHRWEQGPCHGQGQQNQSSGHKSCESYRDFKHCRHCKIIINRHNTINIFRYTRERSQRERERERVNGFIKKEMPQKQCVKKQPNKKLFLFFHKMNKSAALEQAYRDGGRDVEKQKKMAEVRWRK